MKKGCGGVKMKLQNGDKIDRNYNENKKIRKGQSGLKETIKKGVNTVKNSYVGRPLVTGISDGWNNIMNGNIREGIKSIGYGITDSMNRSYIRVAPITTPVGLPRYRPLIDQKRQRMMNSQVNYERGQGRYYQNNQPCSHAD